MALNLSTLTNPATSGTVLAEALTTADFLDPVPILKNLSRGSNKGGDAKQTTALNQPKALPLDANGKGYLYLSGIAGNYASVPDADDLDGLGDFVIEVKDVYLSDWGNSGAETFVSKWVGTSSERVFIFRRNGTNINFPALYGGVLNDAYFAHGLTGPAKVDIKITRSGTSLSAQIDTGSGYASIGSTLTVPSAALSTSGNQLEIGTYWNGSSSRLLGKISRAQMWDNATASGTPVLDVDFTATNVRHGDTKFKCATGQVVTVNQSGNDPATIIKKSVLRFDGVNDGFKGLFDQTINGGYMFAAFSVLSGGALGPWGRVFSINKTGGANDYTDSGLIFSYRSADTSDLLSYKGGASYNHTGLYDSDNGDILHEVKHTETNSLSKVNSADLKGTTFGYTIEGDEFNIGQGRASGVEVSCIDLEYLALFPADSVPDEATSTKIRDYINKRNQIYLRHQTDGFYFFNPQKLAAGDVTSWNGNITGSDLGDTDVATNVTIVQGSQTSQPNADGYSLTFEDNTQHLEWASAYTPNFPAGQTKAWQIVGTSLGTFAYLTQGSVTELNLLGNLGHTSYRQAGDLYGIILLPESATGAEIEQARKLLIDRGAADGSSSTSYLAAWLNRSDIVEFTGVNMSGVVNAQNAWDGCTNMVKFGVTDLSNSNNLSYAWYNTSSLTEFPSGANLGTSASNVAFRFSWQLSGLTSFPALDLSKGNDFTSAWHSCSSLTSFPAGAKLGTSASSVSFTSAWQSSGLTSFSTPLPKAKSMYRAFKDCTSLTDFSSDVFANWTPSILNSSIFHNTWEGCNLTAQSVENILTSIDSSGKFATSDGTSGGNALGGNRIDIHCDGTTLSAATNTAVTSLKSKGWVIVVNGVIL